MLNERTADAVPSADSMVARRASSAAYSARVSVAPLWREAAGAAGVAAGAGATAGALVLWSAPASC